MENTVNTIWERLDASYPERISFITEPDPWRFLVTVMLSASTTDAQAVKATSALFALYPDPESVAGAGDEEIGRLIRSAGLWKTKAPRIREVSAYIAEHGLPSSAEELMKLPGIGEMANMGLIPAGSYENKKYVGGRVINQSPLGRFAEDIVFDPQTSGGLLIAAPREACEEMLLILRANGFERSEIIGRFVAGDEKLYLK